jgi:DmsE family decaheme c-type cytochrome
MRKVVSLGLLLGLASLLGGSLAYAQAPSPRTPSPQAPSPPAQTAAAAPGGLQTCLRCHGNEPSVSPILQTPHGVKGDPHTPFAQEGCESCHGDSAAHIASRSNAPSVLFKGPNISPVAVRNAQCLNCHESGMRMNWQGSAHETNNKACTDCHTIHAAKDPVLVKLTQPDKCFTCHARQRADSFKYSHHPMREGKVVCSDCHNPHGSPGDTKLLKEFTVNETCYTCHAEKRGPLLWEHQPVRENCLNCHTPHGSNEARLMKERMNFLCSSCHSAQSNNSGGAFGGHASIPFNGPASSRLNSALANQRTCVNCHSQVHGSNSPSGAYFFR